MGSKTEKRRRDANDEGDVVAKKTKPSENGENDQTNNTEATARPMKKKPAVSKNRKKSKKFNTDAPSKPKADTKSTTADEATEETNGDASPSSQPVETQEEQQKREAKEKRQQDAAGGANGKKSRFIVFVGNLPYSATVPQIQAHFASVHPTSVRLLHDKLNPSKSRGIAFVEFAGYDHMKTALRTMHHSTFVGVGKHPRTGKEYQDERKINVELTAGGGGNTEARKNKIRDKNFKLNEERARRIDAEEKAKWEKRNKRAAEGGEEKSEDNGGIHPSRRGRVPGGRS